MSSSVGLFMRCMLFSIILIILIIIIISMSRSKLQSLSYQEDSVHFPPELTDPALLAQVTFKTCKISSKLELRDPTCKEVCESDALLVGFPDCFHKWAKFSMKLKIYLEISSTFKTLLSIVWTSQSFSLLGNFAHLLQQDILLHLSRAALAEMWAKK